MQGLQVSLSRAPRPPPQFLLSHWAQVAGEGRPPEELRTELRSESHSGRGWGRGHSVAEDAVQTVERKHFHVTFSSGRHLVRGRQVTKNRRSAAGCGFYL